MYFERPDNGHFFIEFIYIVKKQSIRDVYEVVSCWKLFFGSTFRRLLYLHNLIPYLPNSKVHLFPKIEFLN